MIDPEEILDPDAMVIYRAEEIVRAEQGKTGWYDWGSNPIDDIRAFQERVQREEWPWQ